MTRLIYADAIEKVLEEKHFKRVLDSDRWLIADIKKSIMDLPTVDAVPVIQCKDCKYNSNTEGNYVNCDLIPQMFGKTPDDNYCSDAEPKEEKR